MPKGKPKQKFGKQSLVDDHIDAWDYAEEDAQYERWEEKQVKENKLPVSVAPKPQSEPVAPKLEEPKPQVKKKVEEPKASTEELFVDKEELEELEQFDDWEAAMDALDAKVSKEEEKKAKMANSKPK